MANAAKARESSNFLNVFKGSMNHRCLFGFFGTTLLLLLIPVIFPLSRHVGFNVPGRDQTVLYDAATMLFPSISSVLLNLSRV